MLEIEKWDDRTYELIKSLNNVWIYGAGKYSFRVIRYARFHQIPIAGICVTQKRNCLESIYGIKVQEFSFPLLKNASVIVAIGNEAGKEVAKQLDSYGLKNILLVKNIPHEFEGIQYYITVSEKEYEEECRLLYWDCIHRVLDLENPITFNEKIQWMKLYDSTLQKTRLADKYLVREWVADKIGKEHLILFLGKWKTYEEIDFDSLPNQFVLKCNHGCGCNYIVKNKAEIDHEYLREQFNSWLNTNYAFIALELHYKGIEPIIIAEKYIEEMSGNLFDYKVHCFQGKPTFIQVIGDRDPEGHSGFQAVYDFEWNEQDWAVGGYPRYNKELKKPSKLKELYYLSQRLCADFKYVRIDFYILSEKILFGEMTFTPGAGLYPYDGIDFSYEQDIMLGKYIGGGFSGFPECNIRG